MVEILTFPSGPLETNCYLVIDGKKAAIIDAPPEVAEQLEEVIEERELDIEKLLLTHSHWDHIADACRLTELYKIPLFVHQEDEKNLLQPGADKLPCWLPIQGKKPDGFLHDGDEVTIGESKWRVIHTPGHSPGSVVFFCEKEKLLLSGDTLFKSSIGNLSFPTSEPARMWPSLKKLSLLPGETEVFPGHGTTTTIGKERWLSRAEEIFG